LHVLIAGPALDGGAPARGIVDLVRALSAAGHRSLVVSTGGALTAEVKGFGAECITLDTISINPARILANVPILTGLMRERGCDIVHAHGRAAAWSSYLAARRARKPFLTTWYKGYREQNGFKRFYNSVMVRGERVIALSEQIADLVHERYATPWERIKVIPIGIDMRRFDPAAVSAERVAAVRQSWGAGEAVRIILVAGRMLRRKGHHVVIDAARQLRVRGVKDFLVVFAGSEPEPSRYAAELWDHVVATGTADVVRTTTALADMPAAYLASCAVVSAALEVEGLQRSILEAQAMGRPVIVSDRGAGSDVLLAGSGVAEDRITGFRFPAGDQNALAAAIIRVFSAPESARTAIGLRGRAWIAANFELTMVSEQILALYAELSGPVSGQQRAGSPRAS
jgi:glycosyltransferase involved in cell wall biosynthesis